MRARLLLGTFVITAAVACSSREGGPAGGAAGAPGAAGAGSAGAGAAGSGAAGAATAGTGAAGSGAAGVGAAGVGAAGLGASAGAGGTSPDAGGADARDGGADVGDGGALSCPWPTSAVAVVTLDYDDGLDTQLAVVAPLLDARGLKASFFLANYQGEDHNWALPNLTSPLNERHKAWQGMVAKGHELSAHSVKHPCEGTLDSYTVAKFEAELDDNIARLKRLGAQPPFTFGYPCLAEQGVGVPKMSVEAGVRARFITARKSPEVVADPLTVDLYAVPNMEPMGKTADQLKAMVDEAITKKGWVQFGFHGIGEARGTCPQGNNYDPQGCMLNHNVTPANVHLALLDYLVQKKAQVWTATFKEAVQCFQARRAAK